MTKKCQVNQIRGQKTQSRKGVGLIFYYFSWLIDDQVMYTANTDWLVFFL